MKLPRMLFGLVALCVLSSATLAEDGPHDKAIKARQAIFQLYGYSMGVLGAMAKGKQEYNAELANELATNLNMAANLGQSSLWPAGSDDSNPENMRTRALPAIWESFPSVAEKSDALKKSAVVLAQNAGNGLDALKSAVNDVGKACKGCHDDFRAEKK